MIDFFTICGAIIVIPVLYLVILFSLNRHPRAQRRIGRVGLGVGVFLCLGYLFLPALWPLFWHLRHGNHILLDQRNIHVPLRWVVISFESQGVMKSADLAEFPLFAFPPESMFHRLEGDIRLEGDPLAVRTTPDERLKSWENIYWRMPPGSGNTVSRQMWIESGPQSAACVKSVIGSPPNWASALCLFPDSGWSIGYEGRPKGLETFLETVRNSNRAH
jgi:hypothetical protein